MYKRLGLSELRPPKIALKLVDRSTRLCMGVMKDVLINVGGFIFPIDFVELHIERVMLSSMSP